LIIANFSQTTNLAVNDRVNRININIETLLFGNDDHCYDVNFLKQLEHL